MKKKISIITMLSTIFPSLLIFALVYSDHITQSDNSMAFIVFIYLVFPLIFIVQGIVYSGLGNYFILCSILSSISVLLSFSIWYNVADMPLSVGICLLLSIIAFTLTNKIKAKK